MYTPPIYTTYRHDGEEKFAATDAPKVFAFSVLLCYVVGQLTLAEVLVAVGCRAPAPPQPEYVLREGGA
jgi:hypothetical protein